MRPFPRGRSVVVIASTMVVAALAAGAHLVLERRDAAYDEEGAIRDRARTPRGPLVVSPDVVLPRSHGVVADVDSKGLDVEIDRGGVRVRKQRVAPATSEPRRLNSLRLVADYEEKVARAADAGGVIVNLVVDARIRSVDVFPALSTLAGEGWNWRIIVERADGSLGALQMCESAGNLPRPHCHHDVEVEVRPRADGFEVFLQDRGFYGESDAGVALYRNGATVRYGEACAEGRSGLAVPKRGGDYDVDRLGACLRRIAADVNGALERPVAGPPYLPAYSADAMTQRMAEMACRRSSRLLVRSGPETPFGAAVAAIEGAQCAEFAVMPNEGRSNDRDP